MCCALWFNRESAYDIETYCSAGYVAVGACGGGEEAACANGDAEFILKCCRVVGANGGKLDGMKSF